MNHLLKQEMALFLHVLHYKAVQPCIKQAQHFLPNIKHVSDQDPVNFMVVLVPALPNHQTFAHFSLNKDNLEALCRFDFLADAADIQQLGICNSAS